MSKAERKQFFLTARKHLEQFASESQSETNTAAGASQDVSNDRVKDTEVVKTDAALLNHGKNSNEAKRRSNVPIDLVKSPAVPKTKKVALNFRDESVFDSLIRRGQLILSHSKNSTDVSEASSTTSNIGGSSQDVANAKSDLSVNGKSTSKRLEVRTPTLLKDKVEDVDKYSQTKTPPPNADTSRLTIDSDSDGSPPLLSLADLGRKKRKRKDTAKKARKKLKMDTTDSDRKETGMMSQAMDRETNAQTKRCPKCQGKDVHF